MTELDEERKLAHEAKKALLREIVDAAESGNGETARAMAEAAVALANRWPASG